MQRMSELFHIEKGRIGIKAAVPGKYPLVTTGEKFQSHEEAHFRGDAVCIPMISASGHGDASIKRLHHIQGEFSVGSILCACIAKDEEQVSARYAYHYLTASKDNILVPLMQGSANVSLKLADIEGVEIPLPPLPEQHAIVARLDALADKTRQVAAYLDAVEADAEHLLAQQFRDAIANAPYRPMRDVGPLVRREIEINPETSYPELGIRSFGKGTFHKPAVSGIELGTKRLFRIEPGDLLFSNVFAWEGAIAIAQLEDRNRFGSHRFMTCVVDAEQVEASFLLYYLLSQEGLEKVRAASPGGAGRNRTLGVEKLAKIEVPVPSLAAQRAFTKLQATVAALKVRHTAIRESNAALLPAMLERVFAG